MTTKADLDALDALHAAATAGEWGQNVVKGMSTDDLYDTRTDVYLVSPQNAALIVALRNAWPTVAAELRRARTIEAAARLQRDRMREFQREWPLSDQGSPQWCRAIHNMVREAANAIDAALDAPDESGGR